MLTLLTGQPGAGKTLRMIHEVMEEQKKAPHRGVYYAGINGLSPNLGWIELQAKTEWHKVPDGAIVAIDECQEMWRTRGIGAQVPDYVAAMETHRHRGLDVFCTTQHPMLIDTNIRRLVGRHLHVMRTFGMQRATVHEWHSLKPQPDLNRSDSVRHEWSYPKDVYALYKSAEIHTHKVRIPKRLLFMVAIPVILAALGYVLVHTMRGYVTGDKYKTAEQRQAEVVGGPPVQTGAKGPGRQSKAEYLKDREPRVPGFVHTAAVYDDVTKPQDAPAPVACIVSRTKACQCYSQQGTRLPVGQDLCQSIVETGFFVDWRKPPELTQPQLGNGHASAAVEPSRPALAVMDPPPKLQLSPTPYSPEMARWRGEDTGGGPSTNPRFNPSVRPQ